MADKMIFVLRGHDPYEFGSYFIAEFDTFEEASAEWKRLMKEPGHDFIEIKMVSASSNYKESTEWTYKEKYGEEIMENKPTKENSLYLTIKQVYFDQIIAGTKTEEYREIKDTTYKKYLACGEDGGPYVDLELISEEKLNEQVLEPADILHLYNDGECPLIPNEDIDYLNLAVGYKAERDTATVEVVDYSFIAEVDPETGNVFRFDFDENGNQYRDDEKGRYCFWNIAFHLGDVVEKNIVSK